MHNVCRPADGLSIPEGRCLDCGADPQSPIALAVRAEIQEEEAKGSTRLVCPNCGSPRGFKPYVREVESNHTGGFLIMPMLVFMFIALLDVIAGLGGLSHRGEYECLKCGHVFRRPSRGPGWLGCSLLLLVSCGLLIGLMYVLSR
jgi:DNA-directed RNA polymerase subunit RPC12/RpoP